ncbi:MAG: chorismate synthase, partial [Deltaproteobacteria bacterium]|nr:chorismate synthase [Deltaproteobacteria bacterium]
MNIFLIGYRCSGKTSVGKSLAKKLGISFFDTDSELVRKHGMNISEIVRRQGWSIFREMEKVVIKRSCAFDDYVVATGGGAVLDIENVRHMKESGVLIWLKATPETIKKRILQDKNTKDFRPALTSKGFVKEIEETLLSRNQYYENAMDFYIDANSIGILIKQDLNIHAKSKLSWGENMPGNTFGTLFKITTWGESHGKGVGVVIDGCPPRIPLDESMIQSMLNRRRPGKSAASTTRREPDQAVIMSGVFENKTTGTPIMIMVYNKDADSKAYESYADLFRPGHGDITYMAKYGIRDWRGGGRASARETVARVAAGAVAKAILDRESIEIFAYTMELGGIGAKKCDLDVIDTNMFYCPDIKAAEKMEERVLQVKKMGDSIGGIVE